MTITSIKRIEQAIRETQTALARAMRYLPEFRDAALIAGYEAHIAKLDAMKAAAAEWFWAFGQKGGVYTLVRCESKDDAELEHGRLRHSNCSHIGHTLETATLTRMVEGIRALGWDRVQFRDFGSSTLTEVPADEAPRLVGDRNR